MKHTAGSKMEISKHFGNCNHRRIAQCLKGNKKMKQNLRKFTALSLLLCLLVTSIGMSACGGEDTVETTVAEDVTTAPEEESSSEVSDTEAVSDDTGEETQTENTDPNETSALNNNSGASNITVTVNSSGDISRAVALGLRSAVSIYCTFETTSGGGSYWNPRPSTQTYYTTGSGVIYDIDENGNAFIVTNHHVVYDSSSKTQNGISDKIYIYLYGLESEDMAIEAAYVGGSANYDLAVLRVEASDILKEAYASGAASAVTIGNSDALAPGQTTIAIGNPSADELGGISVTSGIVSVDSEYITMSSGIGSGSVQFRVIRTDAPVNSGNSGGGMYNDRGELIGIVNAKISSSDIENIGYALPSNVVRAIADNIIDYCYGKECESVMRGLLGITVQVSDLETYYDNESGLIVRVEEISVYEVSAGGLAENILKAGDIVSSITVGVRTISVTRQHHLIDAMLDVRVGDIVSMVIYRDGIGMTVSTVITEDCLAEY